MSLDEVKSLLAYQENPVADCSWISALVQRRIEAVDRQIAELKALRGRLERLACRDRALSFGKDGSDASGQPRAAWRVPR